MFTFIWAVGQAPAVESLKTQNSNMYLELKPLPGNIVDLRGDATPSANEQRGGIFSLPEICKQKGKKF